MWKGEAIFYLFELLPFLGIILALLVTSILRGEINPWALLVEITGFLFILIAKISLFKQGRWISLGTKHMSDGMANLYRLGYFFMVIGLIVLCWH